MPYITSDDLASLGHNLSAIDPSVIDGICTRASGMVDGYIQQTLGVTETVEEQTAFITGRVLSVFPDCLPIVSVEYIRFTRVDGAEFEVRDGIRVENSRGCFSIRGGLMEVIDESVPVEFKYKHGYVTIPESAKQAVILTAKVLLDEAVATKMTGFGGSGAVSDNGRSVSRQPTVQEVPEAAKGLLEPFKRVR
jgi:hypothetical protein